MVLKEKHLQLSNVDKQRHRLILFSILVYPIIGDLRKQSSLKNNLRNLNIYLDLYNRTKLFFSIIACKNIN